MTLCEVCMYVREFTFGPLKIQYLMTLSTLLQYYVYSYNIIYTIYCIYLYNNTLVCQ